MKTIAFLTLSASLVWADPLASLSDEFDTPASLSNWTRLNDVEGWNADQLELWDADTSTTGHMRMMPYSSAWFMDLRGVLAFKEVTGDFIVTAKLTVYSRHDPLNPTDPPQQTFSLAGIFAHAPRNITSAAPNIPDTSVSVWPPAANGSDWVPDTDNYVFLSFGCAGNPGVHQYEVKTTRNGNSNLYYNNVGVPNTPDSNEVWLQMVRVGGTIVVLRRHPSGDWIVENRYPNGNQQAPIWGNTVQVGITTYTDWPNIGTFYSGGDHQSQFHHNYQVLDRVGDEPDLIVDVDYVRYATPPAELSEIVLQGLPTSYPANSAPTLPVGIPLGDVANVPIGAFEGTIPEYAFGTSTQPLSGSESTSVTLEQNPDSTAATLTLETSLDLTPISWTACARRPAGSRTWETLLPGVSLEVAPDQSSVTFTMGDTDQRFYRMQVDVE